MQLVAPISDGDDLSPGNSLPAIIMAPVSAPPRVILSYHNSLLHAADVQLLRGPFWLNDQIISFYLEYLEHERYAAHRDRLLFVSPEVTQCMKLVPAEEIGIFLEPLGAATKQFIFFPINDHQLDSAGGSHWSLLVFSRPDRQFYTIDSFSECNRSATRGFVGHVGQALGALHPAEQMRNSPGTEIVTLRCAQQTNGYDCGLHVLWNVNAVAKYAAEMGTLQGVDSDAAASRLALAGVGNVYTMRQEILELIERMAGG